MNDIQRKVLELIKLTFINNFDGEVIGDWLEKNEGQYVAFWLARDINPLIILRDLPENIYNADRLYISTTSQAKAKKIKSIARREWKCDECDIGKCDTTRGRGMLYLIDLWWD